MKGDEERIAAHVVGQLEDAWNAANGAGFAAPFAEDADFVTIRGERHRTREGIAKGHQGIFDTIYKGSIIRCQVAAVREISVGVLLVHMKSTLTVPTGPVAGEHNALATVVLTQAANGWHIAAFHNTLVGAFAR